MAVAGRALADAIREAVDARQLRELMPLLQDLMDDLKRTCDYETGRRGPSPKLAAGAVPNRRSGEEWEPAHLFLVEAHI
jgi:hypothetical protein